MAQYKMKGTAIFFKALKKGPSRRSKETKFGPKKGINLLGNQRKKVG